MDKNSEIIRTEILRILNENGKTRSSELVKRISENTGNEKSIYREISALVESGEIEKKILDRNHIEFELINLSESVNEQLLFLFDEILLIHDEIINFKESISLENLSFQERLRTIIHLIHIVQSNDGIMKLLSYYPSFKKDKMFSQITRKISDCWVLMMDIISHQDEKHFLNEILTNLRLSSMDSNNVN